MPLQRETLLKSILSQPSAPFRERHVIQTLLHALSSGGVPHFQDPIGNIVVGVSSKTEYARLVGSRSPEPLRIYIAHMDHPGFHGAKWVGADRLQIRWHGGSPTQHLIDSKVWLATASGWAGEGRFVEVQMIPSGRAIATGVVEVTPTELRGTPAEKIYGGFKFREPVWQEGDLIYTKAADDLVGSFAIVSLALDLFSKKKKKSSPPPFLGLLTRAEEVGYIGAIGHFNLGWLKKAKRPLVCVSLETSRTLPGAEIGKGPVVRLGDRTTVFDSGALRVFLELAQKTLPDRHQKRIMDGGTCEGTAATAYGYPAVGISVPLGNYHNQNFEGGPDARGPMGPAPEFVHQQDIAGLVELCHALLTPKLNWNQPWKSKLLEFKNEFKKYQPLLKSGP